MTFLDAFAGQTLAGTDPVAAAGAVLGLLGAGAAAVLLLRLRRQTRRQAALETELAAARAEAGAASDARDEARAVLAQVHDVLDGGDDVWRREPAVPPEDYAARARRSIPVLLLANLKGGVGKTTLAANLAGHFDRHGERVLLIDLDYQGSLSAMALGGRVSGRDLANPGAVQLLEGAWPAPLPLAGARSNSALVDGYYPLFNAETRLVYRWLLGGTPDDARYRLAALLQDPQVQTTYDRVIVDTGPRLTLAMVNGLCAATHLVVPTQLNGLSIEAANNFLFALGQLGGRLPLGLRRRRVVALQKSWAGDRLTRAEEDALAQIERMLERHGEPPETFLRDAMIPNMTAFARAAGRSIAYVTEPAVRPAIDRVGAEIGRMAPSLAEDVA
jgi:chromosome partitioning protein